VLSDSILMQLAKPSPLRERLIVAAWPSLSVETKLQVIDAASGPGFYSAPGYLVDLAQADSAEIVRYWATRKALLTRVQNPDEEGVFNVEATSREAQERFARLDADPSDLVRAAEHASWIFATRLFQLPQLARLIHIRNLKNPDTSAFSEFVEEALKELVSVDEIRDCIFEYFSREDVFEEMKVADRDGYSEFSKRRGWENLWRIAATAPPKVAHVIAANAVLVGKNWQVKQELLRALPDDVRIVVIHRDEEPAVKLFESMIADPSGQSSVVANEVRRLSERSADYWMPSERERRDYNLENTPARTEAVFESLKDVRALLERVAGTPEEAAERSASEKRTRELLESIKVSGWVIAALLLIIVFLRR
jgi:hypothetical protein